MRVLVLSALTPPPLLLLWRVFMPAGLAGVPFSLIGRYAFVGTFAIVAVLETSVVVNLLLVLLFWSAVSVLAALDPGAAPDQIGRTVKEPFRFALFACLHGLIQLGIVTFAETRGLPGQFRQIAASVEATLTNCCTGIPTVLRHEDRMTIDRSGSSERHSGFVVGGSRRLADNIRASIVREVEAEFWGRTAEANLLRRLRLRRQMRREIDSRAAAEIARQMPSNTTALTWHCAASGNRRIYCPHHKLRRRTWHGCQADSSIEADADTVFETVR
jgi:hypothetical protein